MHCSYVAAERCRSCTLMGQPYVEQLEAKQRDAERALGGISGAGASDGAGIEWLPPLASRESGFRNKAKMVVGGTIARPTVGILDAEGRGVDLRECGLYLPGIRAILPLLAEFVTRAALTPYDVRGRAGELKNILVTESPDGDLMVRFVTRSQEPVARIRKHLPTLQAAVPHLAVVSVNLLPEHKAVLEGQREILLTEQETLLMRVNEVGMHLRPQSFFQTNTEVAAALYRQARDWVSELAPSSVWDLYCGVGGFALHCAGADREVIGIETSADAVASARLSAREAGLGRVTFLVGDATEFATRSAAAPELVIVNPPRRGLGEELCRWLEASPVQHVVYSSCHAASLARDLATMPTLRPRRARVLDMFPQTAHDEVLVLLERG
ncbi:23S rRNA (uracil(747)-C(5))-methyltransferase RlmC [mine drainage metagenome]|uniref:23S rRNA (Uracil(747)-C(5))-methyltransferase RlmC n=1 Tax=mine drainage metagenome TaxID=410659 RepID=A0A1J5R832_9ZZZZ